MGGGCPHVSILRATGVCWYDTLQLYFMCLTCSFVLLMTPLRGAAAGATILNMLESTASSGVGIPAVESLFTRVVSVETCDVATRIILNVLENAAGINPVHPAHQ